AGVMGTEFKKQIIASTSLGRVVQPEDNARVAVFLASDDAGWLTGGKHLRERRQQVKQVASLKAHLGAQLLMRTSRNLSLTKAVRDFYESGARLIGDLQAAESRVDRGQAYPSGVVRVTLAHAFSRLN